MGVAGVLCLAHHYLDAADLGVRAGCNNHREALAARYQGPHVHHVRPVGQRKTRLVEEVRRLVDRHALAGKG